MQHDTAASAPRHPSMTTRATHPRRLVVLVPGFGGRCSLWAPLKQRLVDEAPGFSKAEAQWLDFDHQATRGSVGRIDDLAKQLNARIHAQWLKDDGFDEVVLVGHSMGGSVARQAYLLAVGAVRGEDEVPWGRRVVRIVLLASINRGIETNRTLATRFLVWVARIVPFLPHLRAQDILRGSNFLTNLRIDWIRHFDALAAAQRCGERWPDETMKRPPLVIQILGSQDGMVHQDDSEDILAFPNGHYLKVPDADHASIYRIDLAAEPDLRFAVLKEGFAGTFPTAAAVTATRECDGNPIKRVIFLLHGIRASNVAQWISQLKERLEKRDPQHTAVMYPTYGYFTAARFVLPSVRRRNIRDFRDWYTEALAKYPNAEFSIIAHSNGTYILGQSLLVTPGMTFTHVALAGSVLPRSFSWSERMAAKQVVRVRNDRANRDVPVAILCNALRGLRMKDLGTGGFDGFHGGATDEVAYYPGGHSVALTPQFQASLVDFVFGEQAQKPKTLVPSPGYFRQLSNAMPYLAWLLVLLLLGGAVWLIALGCWSVLLWSLVVAVIVYIILDII